MRDRIITGHIAILTSVLKDKQAAKIRYTWGLILGGVALWSVFAIVGKFAAIIADAALRKADVEVFGEFRSAVTERKADVDENGEPLDPETIVDPATAEEEDSF